MRISNGLGKPSKGAPHGDEITCFEGQKRPPTALVDDVVSADYDCLRECKPDRFGGLKVDDELELQRRRPATQPAGASCRRYHKSTLERPDILS
jgi:hypothetical protein